MKELPVVSFAFQGAEYAPGLVRIDEEHTGAELLHRKKSFRKEQLVSVTKFSYDVSTAVSLEQTTVRAGDVSMRMETQQQASELLRLLNSPVALAYGSSLSEIKGPLRGFIMHRSEGLGLVENLNTDPRSSLVRNRDLVPENSPDPVTALREAFMEQLSEQLEEVQNVLYRSPEKIRAKLSGTIYALTCALCAIQDSRLSGDERAAKEAMELLASLTQLRVAVETVDGEEPAPRSISNMDVAGRFLDAVLAGLRDRFASEGSP